MTSPNRRACGLLVALVVAIPFLALAIVELNDKSEQWDLLERYPVADRAVLEIYTIHVLRRPGFSPRGLPIRRHHRGLVVYTREPV